MKNLVLLVCALMAGVFSNNAIAQSAPAKFAFVSVEEVVQLLPEYKKAMLTLAQFDSALQINYAETVQELNKQDSIYKTDSSKWSVAIKTANKERMKKLFTELQGFEQGYQQQMQQKNEELLAPVAQKANGMVQEVAKASGYTYVFRKEALLVSPESDDLLPLIKKRIGSAAPVAKPAGK